MTAPKDSTHGLLIMVLTVGCLFGIVLCGILWRLPEIIAYFYPVAH